MIKYKSDQILSSGSIIHWSEGYYKGKSHFIANVTCSICRDKRKLNIVQSSKWTGQCRKCKNGAQFGSKNPLYRSGKTKRFGGYNFLLISCLSEDDQKLAKQMITHKNTHNNEWGYVSEHRLVVAKHLGRPLKKSEIVHHLNEIKDDNRIENLTITDSKSHAEEHQSILKSTRIEIKRLQKILEDNGIKY